MITSEIAHTAGYGRAPAGPTPGRRDQNPERTREFQLLVGKNIGGRETPSGPGRRLRMQPIVALREHTAEGRTGEQARLQLPVIQAQPVGSALDERARLLAFPLSAQAEAALPRLREGGYLAPTTTPARAAQSRSSSSSSSASRRRGPQDEQ